MLDHLSNVYRSEPKASSRRGKTTLGTTNLNGNSSRGKLARKSSETASRSVKSGLPSVTAVARFALERERLAREMGLEELGGPATLGVVNVGAYCPGRRREMDDSGNKQRKSRNDQRTNEGGGAGPGEKGGGVAEGDRGEALLKKLERVAEARSVEVRVCLLYCQR